MNVYRVSFDNGFLYTGLARNVDTAMRAAKKAHRLEAKAKGRKPGAFSGCMDLGRLEFDTSRKHPGVRYAEESH